MPVGSQKNAILCCGKHEAWIKRSLWGFQKQSPVSQWAGCVCVCEKRLFTSSWEIDQCLRMSSLDKYFQLKNFLVTLFPNENTTGTYLYWMRLSLRGRCSVWLYFRELGIWQTERIFPCENTTPITSTNGPPDGPQLFIFCTPRPPILFNQLVL